MATSIAFIGAGNMASAIIGGLIQQGTEPSSIWAADPFPEALEKLNQAWKINTDTNNDAVIAQADVVVLAVKPQIMKQVCASIQAATIERKPLIISIAAGLTLDAYHQWLSDDLAIIRCMPNTPALLGLGATAMYANDNVSEQQKTLASSILDSIGISHWVEKEMQLDSVTALSGSGPAYFFRIMEIMAEHGVTMGLDPELSQSFTIQTALGAAQMALQSDVDLATLRERVTSPNGTTEAALNTLDSLQLPSIFHSALNAAHTRSTELASELTKED